MIRRRARSGDTAPPSRHSSAHSSSSRGRTATATTVSVIAVSIVLATAAAIGAFVVTDHFRGQGPVAPRTAAPPPPVVVAGTQLPSSGPSPVGANPAGTSPTASGVAHALTRLVGAGGLGKRLRADVIDVATGHTLYSRKPGAPTAPASTAKLLTATALLSVHPASYRIATRVVAGPGNSVVLVGGGDPTLSGAAAGDSTAYPEAARISDLASQVRRTVPHPSRILVDDSLFTGPTVLPAWAPEDVPSSYGAPITAVMADGGRANPSDVIRSGSPDLDAGDALAVALGDPSTPVTRGHADAGAAELGTVKSAPMGVLIEQMLQESDNVIAEMLGRQVALAESMPASFAGAVAAIRTVLTGIGVNPGTGMHDASGLAASDRLTSDVLAHLVTLIADGRRPELSTIAASLPVAAWSGTLSDRYETGPARTARGLVHAKTGTLTGVSTLAGFVRDRSGRLLAFALMADRTSSTPAAEAALDRIPARLSACGCS